MTFEKIGPKTYSNGKGLKIIFSRRIACFSTSPSVSGSCGRFLMSFFDADDIMLATEFRDLMHSPPQAPLRMQPIPLLPGWNAYLPPLAQTPFDTRQVFLYEAHRLGLK